jgi:hypothetical protein
MADSTQFASERVSPGASDDLSDEITRSVEKQSGDMVKCTRVSVDGYRCNWWAPHATAGYDNPSMSGLLVTTHRVRRSRFLRVTKENGRLVIRELPTRPPEHDFR